MLLYNELMRPLLLVIALCLSLSAWGQSEIPHGKTEAQILKMGPEAWMSYYSDKVGGSTADMCEGASIYGKAALHRNNALLAKQLDADVKQRIAKLRSLMTTYATSSIDVNYCLSGGGTMYNPMWASVQGEVEDTLYRILTSTGPKPKNMVVSQVTKAHTALGKRISGASANEYVKVSEAKKALAEMKKAYDGIVAVAKHMSRKDSDRVLGFCYTRAVSE